MAQIIDDGNSITLSEPTIVVSIDKEYFRDKFEKVFKKWEYDLGNGLDLYKEKELFDDLMSVFDEK